MEHETYQLIDKEHMDNENMTFQISEQDQTMQINDQKIKEILKHHRELVKQIHRRIIDIRKLAEETNDQLIEVASFAKRDLHNAELTDVYIRYQQLIKEKEQDLADEMSILSTLAEGVNRLYICFQALQGLEYDILDRLYVQKLPYKAVEQESGLNHRIFESKRKYAIEQIQLLYESDLTNAQILHYSEQQVRKKKSQTKRHGYEQLSMFD